MRAFLLTAITIAIGGAGVALQSQESPPQRPPSDKQPSEQDQRAHTNYALEAVAQPIEAPTLSAPLHTFALPKESASNLQIVRPQSDVSIKSTSEKLARLALINGEAPPAGAEIRAHTDYEFLVKANGPPGLPLSTLKNGTPSEIRTRYGLPASGTGGVLYIVDAYRYPTAEADLALFSAQFALPPCSTQSGCLQLVPMAPGILADTDPSVPDCGWSGEAALDLQWGHAIAPQAKLVLIQAVSSKMSDMLAAVDKASEMAERGGGGIVSLSWSYDEFQEEKAADSHFAHDTVLYFAASGDNGGVVQYPSTSPSVVSVGGTDVIRDANNKVVTEEGWSSSGGGNSRFEARPNFQQQVENVGDAGRATPDIAGPAGLDVEGNNGSPVFAGTVCAQYTPGWYLAGGTSLATPIIAAAVSFSEKAGKTPDLLKNIYAERARPTAIRDITVGSAGANLARTGYDRVTGVGVPANLGFARPLAPTP